MGTNFYLRGYSHSDDPSHHIGKRSAAGLYCWTHELTLCKRGEKAIHFGRGNHQEEWYQACPVDGESRTNTDLLDVRGNSVGVELGFAQPNLIRPIRGVRSASSFTWAMEPGRLNGLLLRWLPLIVDEYGRSFTGRSFLRMLDAQCPIRFYDSIGKEFS